jgi:hypothetical protein
MVQWLMSSLCDGSDALVFTDHGDRLVVDALWGRRAQMSSEVTTSDIFGDVASMQTLGGGHIWSHYSFTFIVGARVAAAVGVAAAVALTINPAVVSDPALTWTPVTDPASGNVYWWNTVTNETTYIGAPKPLGATLATSPNYAAVAALTKRAVSCSRPRSKAVECCRAWAR